MTGNLFHRSELIDSLTEPQKALIMSETAFSSVLPLTPPIGPIQSDTTIQSPDVDGITHHEKWLTRIFFLMGLFGAYIGFTSGVVSSKTDLTVMLLLILGCHQSISRQSVIPMLGICCGLVFSPVTAHFNYAMPFIGIVAALILSILIEPEASPVGGYYQLFRATFFIFICAWLIFVIFEVPVDSLLLRSLHITAVNLCNFLLLPALLLMVINRAKIDQETCNYMAILVACTGLLITIAIPRIGSPQMMLDPVSGVAMSYKVLGTQVNYGRAVVGGFLGIILSPLPFLLLVEKKPMTGMLLAIVTTVGIITLLFSGARGGLIIFSLIQIIGFLMVKLLAIRIRADKFVLFALIGLIAITYLIDQESMYRWNKSIVDRWTSILSPEKFSWIEDRPSRWRIGINFLFEYPLGVGWEKAYFLQRSSLPFHNDFLVIGVAQGVIAMMAYATMLIAAMIRGLNLARSSLSNSKRMSGLAGMLTALAFVMSSFFDHQTSDMIRYQCSWFLVGASDNGN